MTRVRCPACRTIFRAHAEQLRSHSGMVRCGQCRIAFNALAHQLPEPASSAASDSHPTFAPSTPHASAADVPAAQAENTTPPPIGQRHASDTDRPAAIRPRRRDTGGEATPAPSVQDEPGSETMPDPAAHQPENLLVGEDFESRLAELHRRKEETLEPEPSVESENAPEQVLPSPPASATGGRILRGLVVGMLLGALAVQGLYLLREPVSRHWPQLRPLLVSACASLGCEIPLPKMAEHITISNSALEPVSENPRLFVLHAKVHNEAPFLQAYPYLELTLTDAADEIVTRRSLTPEQWLSESGDLEPGTGFEGGASVSVKLPFAATDSEQAQGYRLYAFYP